MTAVGEGRKGALGFVQHEAAGGLMLLVAAIAALLVCNSPLAGLYEYFFATPVGLRLGSIELEKPLLLWINDGLMAIFFFLVGLEIKRELLVGELHGFGRAALPGIAAVGGMAMPVLIYVAINSADAVALRGWAIPAATDIAFAVAVLALLGDRVAVSLKVFLLALAILDDLGSIVIIAIFYTADLHGSALLLAAIGCAVLGTLNWGGVRRLAPYLVTGVFIWVCVLNSGVHATLAGVVVAIAVPLAKAEGEGLAARTVGREFASLDRLRSLAAFCLCQRRRLAGGIVTCQADRSDTARHSGWPRRRQAARHFRGHLAGGSQRIGAETGGRQLGANSRCWHARRHRFHHEPVHRHAGFYRCKAGHPTPAGGAGSLPSVGHCRLLGVALQCPCAARIAGRSFVSRLCAVIGPTCL